MLTKEDIEILSKEFPQDKIGVKINSLSKNKDRALLVLYLQHTDVYSRIEEVDPAWSCEVVGKEIIKKTVGQNSYDLCNVSMKITIKGVTRENVGEGDDYKGAYSDALKRAAMLFGIGRYLYDQETAWVPYNEQTDKFKHWTMEDFKKVTKNKAHPNLGATLNKPSIVVSDVGTAGISDGCYTDGHREPLVFDVGKHKGRSFEAVLEEDVSHNYAYWVKNQYDTNLGKIHPTLKEFYEYCNIQGVYNGAKHE